MTPGHQVEEPPPTRPVMVRDGKAGLPYSKGIMATSVMAAGLPPLRAYDVAEAIERLLHDQGRTEVSSEELRELAFEVLTEEIGLRYADNYRRWQTAQTRETPLIVLIGGATGVGKSTIATALAHRLGIVRISSTDAIREVMRGIITEEMMPALHVSSFEVPSRLREALIGADPVLAGFREQVQAVSVGVTKIIRRALREGTDLIVEGAHVVPGFLELPKADEAIVAQQIIAVEDRDLHRSHIQARAQETRRRGEQRYLDHFEDIRKIQQYVTSLAMEYGVPVVPTYSLDTTIARVMELVVSSATDEVSLRPPASLGNSRDEPSRTT